MWRIAIMLIQSLSLKTHCWVFLDIRIIYSRLALQTKLQANIFFSKFTNQTQKIENISIFCHLLCNNIRTWTCSEFLKWMPVWLPLLIWDMNQFQWVWIIFLPENSGKTCSLWFPNVCKPQVGTQGWWVDCVSVKFLGAQSTLHVPAGIFKPSAATTNRWQCSAYLKEACTGYFIFSYDYLYHPMTLLRPKSY